MQLNEMKIIVTGGAQGMGAYFAKKLAEAGAKVCAGDVNEAGLAELPPSVFRRKLNVADEKDCESFVAWAAEHPQVSLRLIVIKGDGEVPHEEHDLLPASHSTGRPAFCRPP